MDSLPTRIEFSEALCTELRRKVNDSRKVKSIDASALDHSELRDHDKAVILTFLEDEFSLSILKIWQAAQLADPWLDLRDWGFPGAAIIERAEESELGELIEPLMSKGHLFIISHSGLYNAKLTLIRD
jgi:hypothetical protein